MKERERVTSWRIPGLVAWSVMIVLLAISMFLYPRDTGGVGYGFWRDFLCNLFDERTYAGRENPGRWWAVVAFAVLGFTVFTALAEVAREHRRRWLERLGIVAGSGTLGIALAVALHGGAIHGVLVLITGPAAIVGLFAALRLQKEKNPIVFWIGVVTLLLALGNLIQYARQFALEAERWSGLPALQKLVTFGAFAWIALTLATTRPSSGESSRFGDGLG